MPKKSKKQLTLSQSENMWNEIALNSRPLIALNVKGANRHRRECFKITKHLCGNPKSSEQLKLWLMEYFRQLIGPEIYDTFENALEREIITNIHMDVEEMFKEIQKYILGF